MYRSTRFLGPAFTLFGLVAVLIGASSTVGAVRSYNALRTRGVVADATVTQVLFREHRQPTGKSYEVTVEFATPNGLVHEDLPVRGTAAEGVEAGAHLQVTYDRLNPANVTLTELAGSPNLLPAVPILLGGLLGTTLGIGLVVASLRRRTPPATVP
jgi:Protein of unknown function (DUF3592)